MSLTDKHGTPIKVGTFLQSEEDPADRRKVARIGDWGCGDAIEFEYDGATDLQGLPVYQRLTQGALAGSNWLAPSPTPAGHTPLPWHVGQIRGADKVIRITSACKELYCEVSRDDRDEAQAEADARLIVRAVNSHPDLVATLRNILAASQAANVTESKMLDNVHHLAEAALTKAGTP